MGALAKTMVAQFKYPRTGAQTAHLTGCRQNLVIGELSSATIESLTDTSHTLESMYLSRQLCGCSSNLKCFQGMQYWPDVLQQLRGEASAHRRRRISGDATSSLWRRSLGRASKTSIGCHRSYLMPYAWKQHAVDYSTSVLGQAYPH